MGSTNMKAVVFCAAFALFVCNFLLAANAQNTDPTKAAGVVPQASEQKTIAHPDTAARDDRYLIGYEDTVQVQIFKHPDYSKTLKINPNGTINLYGIPTPIVAVCKTEQQLAADIADAYRKDLLRNPQVNVIAVEQRSQAFAVIGAVEKPGSYFINRRVKLLELIAYAGGPSKEAGTRMIVARTGSTSNCQMNAPSTPDPEDAAVVDFKVQEVLEGKNNLEMKPGDIVSVLKADVVYVYGHVKKQGQVPIRQPLTLTQAIVSAEGLEPAAKRNNIRILRQKPGSLEREELIYNLKDIDSRKVEDPYLQPNDIVAVSQDRTKSILNSIGKSLTSGVSTIFYRIP